MEMPSQSQAIVQPNSRVVVELIEPSGESEQLTFVLVPDEQADFYAGFLGLGTPLAQAILGQPAGSLCFYEANGIQRARVVNILGDETGDSGEAAARRKAAAEDAVRQVQRTNAMIFATTVEGKWGGYDADGMMEGWQREDTGGEAENSP